MKRTKIIICFLLCIFVVFWLQNLEKIKQNFIGSGENIWKIKIITSWPAFAILPHHGITGDALHSFYKELSTEYPSVNQIILISPDHYNTWGGFAQGVSKDGPLCFTSSCISAKKTRKFYTNRSGLSSLYYMKRGNSYDTRTWYRNSLFIYTWVLLNGDDCYSTGPSSWKRNVSKNR